MSMVKDFVQERLFMLVDKKTDKVYFKEDTPNLMEKLEITSMVFGIGFTVSYDSDSENYIVSLSPENPNNNIPTLY